MEEEGITANLDGNRKESGAACKTGGKKWHKKWKDTESLEEKESGKIKEKEIR